MEAAEERGDASAVERRRGVEGRELWRVRGRARERETCDECWRKWERRKSNETSRETRNEANAREWGDGEGRGGENAVRKGSEREAGLALTWLK